MFVKCCHDGGCEWTGTLEQSVNHFKTCSMRSVLCPLHAHHVCTDKKCTGSIKRKDVNSHVSEGSKRAIANTMLIMAETIAYQKKEIELLHKFILSGDTKIHKIGQSTFVGKLKDGEMDGFGLLKLHSGTSYSGHFHKGQYDGFGVIRSNQCVKAGEWENGKLNGHGMVRQSHIATETLQNCEFVDTYIGNLKGGLVYGFGRFIDTDTTDVGSFENGMLHGEVTRFSPNDNIFTGSFEEGKRCTAPPCTLTAQNGTIFVGIIDEHWHFTEGKFTTAAGVVYEGTFCDNANGFRLNGTGTITYTDGSVYTGEFRRGLKHGKGSLIDSNGVVSAAGEWNNDKPEYPIMDFRRGTPTFFNRLRSNGMIGYSSTNVVDGALHVSAVSGSEGQNTGTAGVAGKRKYSQ